MGQPPNQLVGNKDNSSGKGQAHLENTKRKINNYYCGLALLPTRLEQAQLIDVKKSTSWGKGAKGTWGKGAKGKIN